MPTQDPKNNGREADALLNRDAPGGYLEEWTERIAAGKTSIEAAVQTVFIFRCGAEWLALPARAVHEVGEKAVIHSIPHRRGGVLAGLTSVRGELLLCVSLETLLGSESPGVHDVYTGPSRMIVAARDGDRLAFPAAEVHGLHRYSPRELRPVPSTLPKAANLMIGILPWREKTVGCLNDDLVFDSLKGALS
jgi:chemotaxis-related protein WspD